MYRLSCADKIIWIYWVISNNIQIGPILQWCRILQKNARFRWWFETAVEPSLFLSLFHLAYFWHSLKISSNHPLSFWIRLMAGGRTDRGGVITGGETLYLAGGTFGHENHSVIFLLTACLRLLWEAQEHLWLFSDIVEQRRYWQLASQWNNVISWRR